MVQRRAIRWAQNSYSSYASVTQMQNQLVVGEPKSRIMQKHIFFAPERYTAGILYTDSLNGA